MTVPSLLLSYADELEKKIEKVYPRLAPLAKQCFLNTIETTVKKLGNNDYFVITGDIPAMWLRDSSAQLRPYAKLCTVCPELCEVFRGAIFRHAKYIKLDPYSNAFNSEPNERAHKDDTDFAHPLIWERKYEVDSLCASVYLLCDYVDATGDITVFTNEVHEMLKIICDTFRLEQNHDLNSKYYFYRTGCPKTDTLCSGGKGSPVGYTGMTWSGFRPSDDSCTYHYLIPAEMMCVVAMRRASEMLLKYFGDEEYAMKCRTLADEVDEGIKKYGIVTHPVYGDMYAYETDGLGNHLLMDDANSPGLLAMPYLGYCDKNDPLYLNTRRFILSSENPWYFEGTAAKGIGSPHTGKDRIWHIALIMQILTSSDESEKKACLEMIADTHAGTNYMHESFNKDNPADYSRSWFAWANSLFGQMLDTL